MSLNAATDKFVRWLDDQVLFCARGDNLDRRDVDPEGRFWLGRLGDGVGTRRARRAP